MPHNGNLSSDEGYGQNVGTYLAKQLFHLVILDKGLWLTAQIVAFHLYALILQHIDERGDAQQILVYTGAAYSRGAAHGRVENLAQGGLSVAGGCRCLTKELDMIAC